MACLSWSIFAALFAQSAHAGDGLDHLPVGVVVGFESVGWKTAGPKFTFDIGIEHASRELPHFRDTAIIRSAGKQFYSGSPTIKTEAIVFGAGLEFGSLEGALLPRKVRIEGRLRRGEVRDQDHTEVLTRNTTATISIDGVWPQPGRFIPSTYKTDFTMDEVAGEINVLGEVARKAVGRANLALSLGSVVGFRNQNWNLDHISNLTSAGPIYAAYDDRNAVHYVHESLHVMYGGVAVQADAELDLAAGFHAQFGVRAMGYLQDAHLTGDDCFSGAFRVGAQCDGLHHTANNGRYYGRVSERFQNIGGHVRVTGGLSKAFDFKHFGATIRVSGFVETWLNDPAILNPTFDEPGRAQVKYENTAGYGWSIGGKIRF